MSQAHVGLVAAKCLFCTVEVRLKMNFTILLKMLLELEQAIGVESEMSIKSRIQDIESRVLATQKESIEQFRNVKHRHFAA